MTTQRASRLIVLTLIVGFMFPPSSNAEHFATTPKGIILLQKRAGEDDEFCEPLDFVSMEEFPVSVVVQSPSRGKVSLPRMFIKTILYFQEIQQVASQPEMEALEKLTASYADALKRFPKARHQLQPVHENASLMLQKAKSGLFLVGGKWITKQELDALNHARPSTGGRDMLIQGKALKEARLTSVADGKAKVLHGGGITSFPVDKLTEDEKRLLLTTSTAIKSLDAPVVASAALPHAESAMPSGSPQTSDQSPPSGDPLGDALRKLMPEKRFSIRSEKEPADTTDAEIRDINKRSLQLAQELLKAVEPIDASLAKLRADAPRPLPAGQVSNFWASNETSVRQYFSSEDGAQAYRSSMDAVRKLITQRKTYLSDAESLHKELQSQLRRTAFNLNIAEKKREMAEETQRTAEERRAEYAKLLKAHQENALTDNPEKRAATLTKLKRKGVLVVKSLYVGMPFEDVWPSLRSHTDADFVLIAQRDNRFKEPYKKYSILRDTGEGRQWLGEVIVDEQSNSVYGFSFANTLLPELFGTGLNMQEFAQRFINEYGIPKLEPTASGWTFTSDDIRVRIADGLLTVSRLSSTGLKFGD